MLGIGRRVPDERRMPILRNHPALGAALADWHVEYHVPPAILTVHIGDGGEVTQLEAIAASDAPRFFLLSGIHLRDLPGLPPARLELPHFTHELVLWTIEPGHAGYDDPLPWPTLQPHSISVQFECDDDDQAVEVFEKMAWGMVNGLVPADPQVYVPELGAMRTLAQLRTAWTDTVRATAEHARTGGTHDLGHHG
jgi:hypothetical protein